MSATRRVLDENASDYTMYYLAVVNDDDHHNHNHRIHRKKKKKEYIKREGGLETVVGRDSK